MKARGTAPCAPTEMSSAAPSENSIDCGCTPVRLAKRGFAGSGKPSACTPDQAPPASSSHSVARRAPLSAESALAAALEPCVIKAAGHRSGKKKYRSAVLTVLLDSPKRLLPAIGVCPGISGRAALRSESVHVLHLRPTDGPGDRCVSTSWCVSRRAWVGVCPWDAGRARARRLRAPRGVPRSGTGASKPPRRGASLPAACALAAAGESPAHPFPHRLSAHPPHVVSKGQTGVAPANKAS